jgi:hypothetical protein
VFQYGVVAKGDDLPEETGAGLAIQGVIEFLNAKGGVTESGCSGDYPLGIGGMGEKVNLGAHSILFLLVPPLELLDPASRVDQLLLAGVEGMAVRAKVDTLAIDGGICLVFRTTSAGKGGFIVFGV